jgi:hypothetical protein
MGEARNALNKNPKTQRAQPISNLTAITAA